MSRVVLMVMVMVVVAGLWVMGQAINAKRAIEEHYTVLMNMVGEAEK